MIRVCVCQLVLSLLRSAVLIGMYFNGGFCEFALPPPLYLELWRARADCLYVR